MHELPTGLALFARFPASWDHIEPLRQYAELSIKTRTDDATADKTNIVVQELLENAIKYAEPKSEVELEISIARTTFDVCVRNTAAPSRLTILQREFQRVTGDTARDSFNRALQRLQRLPAGTSMLGLSRVAMEAALQLEIEGERVTITARMDLPINPKPKR